MKFTYRVTAEDLLAFSLYQQDTSPLGRRQKIRAAVALGVIYLGYAILISLLCNNLEVTVVAIFVAAVLTLVSALRYRQRIEAAYRTLADDPARGPMYGPCSLEITDQGLRSVSPISESLHKWHGVSKVAARGGHVFVVLAS